MHDDKAKAFIAVKYNNLAALKLLIETNGVSTDVVNAKGETLAHGAAENGNVEIIRYLLEKDPSIVTKRRAGNQHSALAVAVQYGALDLVRYLFGEGGVANVCTTGHFNLEYDRGRPERPHVLGSFVHLAAKFGRTKVVKYFIEEKGVNVDVPCSHAFPHYPPLIFTALKYKRRDIVEYLMEEKKVDLTIQDEAKENILFEAVRSNDCDFIEYVLDKKKVELDLNHKNERGRTLVHEAALLDRIHILRYLIGWKHADVNSPEGSYTPLHCACSKKHFQVVQYLVEHGADINRIDENGNTALHSAATERIWLYLIKKGVDIEKPNNAGMTPLHIAASKYLVRTCMRLVEQGADIDRQDDAGSTPLHFAVSTNDESSDLCAYLIEEGADVNRKNNKGESPLHVAVALNRYEISAYLVQHKADINQRNNDGQTPLEYAIKKGYNELCQFLLEHGADVNKDGAGTAVHLAAATNQIDLLDYLVIEKHVDVNVTRPSDLWTPLHCAAFHGKLGALNYLIDRGADQRAKDKYGKTPAEVAVNQKVTVFTNPSATVTKPRRRRNVSPTSSTFPMTDNYSQQKILSGSSTVSLSMSSSYAFHLTNLFILYGLVTEALLSEPRDVPGADNTFSVAEDAISTFASLEYEQELYASNRTLSEE